MIMIVLHILAALFFWPALFITIPMHILINRNSSNVTVKEKKHSSFAMTKPKSELDNSANKLVLIMAFLIFAFLGFDYLTK